MKGIYQIKNIINNKVYIGSSNNITKRWKQHIDNLVNNLHKNYKLQNEFNEYGMINFYFSILEIVKNEKDLFEREQDYIDNITIENNYNILSYANYEYVERIKDNYSILEFKLSEEDVIKLKNNLIVFNNEKMNNYKSLSKSWFLKCKKEDINKLNKNLYNYFINYFKAKHNMVYWTSFIEQQKKLSGKGYTRSFVSLIDVPSEKRNILAFVADSYANSFIKHQIEINDNVFALNVLLKWITNVSDINKPINIYIPSNRMRNIIIDYLGLEKIEYR